MLEVGWSEILVIALILIIVVGPKDLPGMLRNFGRMATRVRSMANDFKGQFDQAMREAELEEVSKSLGEVRKLNPTNSLRDAINPIRQLGQDIKTDLQKASDFSAKPAVEEGTKVSELASDPAIDPEPVKAESAKPEAAKTEPASPAASALPPYAAMPVVNATPDEVMAKVKRRKADVADAAALAAQPVPAEDARKSSRKKAATQAAEADPFPPPARKKVTRKATEKHTEHNVQVVSSDAPAAAPAKKTAPRKKPLKAGDE